MLHAIDSGPWQEREWKATPASIVDGTVEAALPPDRPPVVFLNVIDRRGVVSNSPHVIVPKD